MVEMKVVVVVVVVVFLFTGSHRGGGLFWSGRGGRGRVRYGCGFCANKKKRKIFTTGSKTGEYRTIDDRT